MKILFFVGSLRKGSFNLALANEAKKIIGDEAEVEFLNAKEIPFYNQDIEFPAPTAVSELREKVKSADALWIFTPEYNHSFPGYVKNVVDWLSRPLIPTDYKRETPVSNGVIVALSGIGGGSATAYSRSALTEVLTFVGAKVLSMQTGANVNPEAWAGGKLVISEETKESLKKEFEFIKDAVKSK